MSGVDGIAGRRGEILLRKILCLLLKMESLLGKIQCLLMNMEIFLREIQYLFL